MMPLHKPRAKTRAGVPARVLRGRVVRRVRGLQTV